MNPLRKFTCFNISSLLLVSTTALAGYDGREIKVMTQNQYIGADLALLLAAPQNQFNDVLVSVLKKANANRFHDRAQRLATQIAKERPDVVALQEVWRLDCKDLATPKAGKGCKDPLIAGAFIDQLQETLSALKTKGVKYKLVARVKNLDVSLVKIGNLPAGIPFTVNTFPTLLNTIDRDVILVRSDLQAQAVNLKPVCPTKISLEGCHYQWVVNAPFPGAPSGILPIERGFVIADVKVGRRSYRIVNTHLEVRDPAPDPATRIFQAKQAEELITTLKNTTPLGKTLLVLGDMNSSPDDKEIPGIIAPYWQFVEAGYIDTWTLTPHSTPGYTCCQAEYLLNKSSKLYERIDHIFSKQDTWIENIHLVGNRQADKTLPPGARLWPSDHAGVGGELNFW